MNACIFHAEHMKKYYGATHANDDVSIELFRGEVRGLIGENGSGKSTLISMIAGMNHADSGIMEMINLRILFPSVFGRDNSHGAIQWDAICRCTHAGHLIMIFYLVVFSITYPLQLLCSIPA